jgi:hypothetical protein
MLYAYKLLNKVVTAGHLKECYKWQENGSKSLFSAFRIFWHKNKNGWGVVMGEFWATREYICAGIATEQCSCVFKILYGTNVCSLMKLFKMLLKA